ncbi:hypothetical protein BpHYR1_016910 [Brachionus plicatilis]|uniref:Uncharacterized protein n=1 Tax=Brachionus plicatilis TaxID=10195 RepID=A0A3M7SLN9_BRAPC|nr:hypothetical protein BpHYR1_016910 [Brachionus plicatilis]
MTISKARIQPFLFRKTVKNVMKILAKTDNGEVLISFVLLSNGFDLAQRLLHRVDHLHRYYHPELYTYNWILMNFLYNNKSSVLKKFWGIEKENKFVSGIKLNCNLQKRNGQKMTKSKIINSHKRRKKKKMTMNAEFDSEVDIVAGVRFCVH